MVVVRKVISYKIPWVSVTLAGKKEKERERENVYSFSFVLWSHYTHDYVSLFLSLPPTWCRSELSEWAGCQYHLSIHLPMSTNTFLFPWQHICYYTWLGAIPSISLLPPFGGTFRRKKKEAAISTVLCSLCIMHFYYWNKIYFWKLKNWSARLFYFWAWKLLIWMLDKMYFTGVFFCVRFLAKDITSARVLFRIISTEITQMRYNEIFKRIFTNHLFGDNHD